MGTSKTNDFKHFVVRGYLEEALKQNKDIDKEKFIAAVMEQCSCTRRTAMEIININSELMGFKEDELFKRRILCVPDEVVERGMKIDIFNEVVDAKEDTA